MHVVFKDWFDPSFKVRCKPYEYELNGGEGEFKDIYGPNRKRRGIYIKIENTTEGKSGIGEAPIPFFNSASQSPEEEQAEIELVEDLCAVIRAEADSFRFVRVTCYDRLYVHSFKNTEQWVDRVCKKLKKPSLALRSSLVEAVLCACLGLCADGDEDEELCHKYESYYVTVNRWEMKKQLLERGTIRYPEIPEMVACKALTASHCREKKEWKAIHTQIGAPVERESGVKALDEVSDGANDKSLEFDEVEVRSRPECFSRPSLFTADFNRGAIWGHSMSVFSTWETGIGLAHLALTAAHVGTADETRLHGIFAFPKRYTGDSFAEKVTARFIKKCVRSRSKLSESVKQYMSRTALGGDSYIDVEGCRRFLKSREVDPFADDPDSENDEDNVSEDDEGQIGEDEQEEVGEDEQEEIGEDDNREDGEGTNPAPRASRKPRDAQAAASDSEELGKANDADVNDALSSSDESDKNDHSSGPESDKEASEASSSDGEATSQRARDGRRMIEGLEFTIVRGIQRNDCSQM